MRVIEGKLSGKTAADLGGHGNLGDSPVIEVSCNKPTFHESGFASGHAEEIIHVPGLTDLFRPKDGIVCTGWTFILWADKPSFVFCDRAYSRNADDFFTLNN